jgi:hypothetical protein
MADIIATKRGVALAPRSGREVVVLAQPVEDQACGGARVSGRR